MLNVRSVYLAVLSSLHVPLSDFFLSYLLPAVFFQLCVCPSFWYILASSLDRGVSLRPLSLALSLASTASILSPFMFSPRPSSALPSACLSYLLLSFLSSLFPSLPLFSHPSSRWHQRNRTDMYISILDGEHTMINS